MEPQLSTVVPWDEIAVDPSSYVDPQGFVFRYKDEIFRLIRPECAALFERLLEDGALDRLERQFALVRTQRSGLAVAGHPGALVLKHETVSPRTYVTEWCPSMLKDAAVATLDLGIALLDHGLQLQDAYPWNVLFEATKPVFIDVTSIVPISDSYLWPAHEQFDAFFQRPLALMSEGKGRAARSMLLNNISGISLEEFWTMISTAYRIRHPGLAAMRGIDRVLQRSVKLKERIREQTESAVKKAPPAARLRLLQRLRGKVESYAFQNAGDPWTQYYQSIGQDVEKQAKVDRVRMLLERLHPRTLVDLGCNTGVFSLAAAEQGIRVVSVDSSESCVEALYRESAKRQMPVLPLVADVLCATPPFGFLGRQYEGLWERIRSDVVMCLGLMHHLHVSGRQSFDRIAALLDAICTRAAIFEFVAMDDANMPHLPSGRPIHYTLETVQDALSKVFPRIEVFASDRPSRRLLLCER